MLLSRTIDLIIRDGVGKLAIVWIFTEKGFKCKMIEKQVKQSTSGTSFDEQTIFFYIKQIFPDAINRGKYSFVENENIELDVYIPSLHFAIEYDGARWHKNKSDIDNYKNFILSEAGAYWLRIRECGLEDLENNYGEIIYRTVSSTDNGLHLHEVVNKVM